MSSPIDETERAEQAARIQERAEKTRLMPDENGQLVKHRQADDGRWIAVEKPKPSQPQRNRPIQISTARRPKRAAWKPYALLVGTAITLAATALVLLPGLTSEPPDDLAPRASAPKVFPERSVVLVSTPFGTTHAGFVVAPGTVLVGSKVLEGNLVSEIGVRFSDGSSSMGTRSCTIRAKDPGLGVALLEFEGGEAPLRLRGEKPLPAGAPVRILTPDAPRDQDAVLVHESAAFLGEGYSKEGHAFQRVDFARVLELTGCPVLSMSGETLGFLRVDGDRDGGTLILASEILALLESTKKLGPATGRKSSVQHDAQVIAKRLFGAGERYGMSAMAIGMTLRKYAQRGETLELGLQQAQSALSTSIAEADDLFAQANRERVLDLTGRPELAHEVRGLLLQLQREVASLRDQVHRPRGTIREYAKTSRRSIQKLDEMQTELQGHFAGI